MEIISKTKNYLHDTGVRFMLTVPAAVLAASVILMITGIIFCITIPRSRPERNVASVWEQGGTVPYCHVAVYGHGSRSGGERTPASYVEYGNSLMKTDIYNLRKSMQGSVDTTFSVKRKTSEKPIDPEGWEDAFCSFVTADIKCEHQDFQVESDAVVYAVSGNFRAFHPFEFMSGGFLPVESVDRYQIVLNESLAWKFFSSCDVVGERVTLWGKDFTVIGVVREHDDKDLRAYVYFECLEEYCAGLEVPVTPAVMCYEALIPEVIKGSALMEIRNTVPGYDISSPSLYVVSITRRFTPARIWDHMMPPDEMREFLQSYELPFWEVSAQKDITYLFVWMTVLVISVLFVMCTVMLLLRGRRRSPGPVAE